ncbi:MAG: permease [Spirulina sp. SIO3F2]|nr:permease [Spirulina sp. SIO3F2]
MNQLYNAFTLFMSLLVEALPFLLLGVFLSSALLLFVNEQRLVERMPSNPILGAFVGSCVGFLFPVCECGNVPVARRLLTKGAPTAVAIGFLLAAPTINPVVIWATWVAFRGQPEMVVGRVICSLIIATTIGWIFSFQKDPQPMMHPDLAQRMLYRIQRTAAPEQPTLLQSGTYLLGEGNSPLRLEEAADTVRQPQRTQKFWSMESLGQFVENTLQELRELGGMLVLGSAIAAAIQVLAPRELVLSLGQGPVTSILAMMLLAAIVSICSTVDAFFVLAFASTFTTGSLLAFMVFGPMIDLKAMGLMFSIFKPRVVFYLFLIAGQLTLLLTLSYTYFL